MYDLLLEAIEDGDALEIRHILEIEPDVLQKTLCGGQTPLMCAADSLSVKCVQVLIEAGADVNAKTNDGYTALHCVIHPFMGRTSPEKARKVIQILVEAGADLEIQQHYGWTPLMYALIEGTADEVRAFLEVGANPNKIFPQHAMPEFTRGRSVLAMSWLWPEIMEILLESGADIHLRDDYGQTAKEYVRNLEAESHERQKWLCWNLLRKAENQEN